MPYAWNFYMRVPVCPAQLLCILAPVTKIEPAEYILQINQGGKGYLVSEIKWKC